MRGVRLRSEVHPGTGVAEILLGAVHESRVATQAARKESSLRMITLPPQTSTGENYMKHLSLLGLLFCAAALQAQTYTTFKVGNYSTQPNGFSNSGEVVGIFYQIVNGSPTPYGFWRDPQGAIHRLGSMVQPRSVNSSGEFVGTWGWQSCFKEVPPVHTIFLAHKPGVGAWAVNSTGWIAGSTNIFPKGGPAGWSWLVNPQGVVAATFAIDGASSATGMNDLGQVVGSHSNGLGGNPQGYFYDGSQLHDLNVPNATMTLPLAINNGTEIVGAWVDANQVEHAFTWTSAGGYTSFDVPGATATVAVSVNVSGVIAGNFTDSTGGHGFILSNGAFTTLAVPGAVGTSATAINDNGVVVGTWSTKSNLERGYLYTPAK
jgi:probable HAF family extracellular repeat protein